MQAPKLVTLKLTEEQVVTVHAALVAANTLCRDKQLHYLNLHESDKVGPVTRSEAWKTFRKWENHENQTVQVMNKLRQKASLDFGAWQRFSV
jgi:hypothetical protein